MNLLELNNLTLYKGDFQFNLTTFFKKSFIHVHTFLLYITLEKGSNDKGRPFVVTAFSIPCPIIMYTEFYTSLI